MKRLIETFSLKVQDDQTVSVSSLHYQRGRFIILALVGLNILTGFLWIQSTSHNGTHNANIRKMKILAQETSALTDAFNKQIAALSVSYSYYGKALKADSPKRQKAMFTKYEESLGAFNDGGNIILEISQRIHQLSKEIQDNVEANP